MFGHVYFGAGYFGPAYFGPGVAPPTPVSPPLGGGGPPILRATRDRLSKKARDEVDATLERVLNRLERADEQDTPPPPAAETVATVKAAIADIPDLSAVLPTLNRINELLEQLGQESAARSIALAAKREADEDEEAAVIALLLH